jgi:hypothetical protein
MHRVGTFALAAVFAASIAGLACSVEPKLPAPEPPSPQSPALPVYETFESSADAMREVLLMRPAIIGVGEVHQQKGSPSTRSALRRFTEDMLAPLQGKATDLIAETWMVTGKCGAAEVQVTVDVEATTRRPENTETEVVKLLKAAKSRGMQPHILEVHCSQYDRLLGKGKKVEYDALLSLITDGLTAKATKIWRSSPGRKKTIVLYGGALHNDLLPLKELKRYAYAPALRRLSNGAFIELDLYVPELVEGDPAMKNQKWYSLLGQASGEKVILVKRGKGSFVLIMRKGIR